MEISEILQIDFTDEFSQAGTQVSTNHLNRNYS